MPAILVGPRPVEEPTCPTCGNAPEPLAWIVHHAKGNPQDVVLWCKFNHGWSTTIIRPAVLEATGPAVVTWHPDTCTCVFRYRWEGRMVYHEAVTIGAEHAGLTGEEAFTQALAENQAKNLGLDIAQQAVPRLLKTVKTPDGELRQPIDSVRWEWRMVPDGPRRQAIRWRVVGDRLTAQERATIAQAVAAGNLLAPLHPEE